MLLEKRVGREKVTNVYLLDASNEKNRDFSYFALNDMKVW